MVRRNVNARGIEFHTQPGAKKILSWAELLREAADWLDEEDFEDTVPEVLICSISHSGHGVLTLYWEL